ncbi:glycosyltransferase [Nocardia sp. NPDC020380]|uniref:glycosyltransferase n=1 Tax=Nocardia sp. NPDC020380 TaxID=3364309 RepID=UPI0037B1A220
MRILVTTGPMVGHFYPMVPLSWALRTQGHHVLVATPDYFAPAVVACGFPVVGLPSIDIAQAMSRDRQGNPVPADYYEPARMRRSGRGWGRLAADGLDGVRRVIAEWQPQCVLSDPMEMAGRLAAAEREVPWVEHGWGVRPSPYFEEAAAAELVPELRRLGLDRLPRPGVTLDVCPPGFDVPAAVPGRPMRYVPFSGPAERPRRYADGRPLIFLTFGTLLPRANPEQALGLLEALMRELTAGGLDFLVGIDPDLVAGMRPFPSGARAVGRIPLDQALSECAAVVHYGNSGAMMTALAHGVPQVVLAAPVADAPDNAERVAASGAGIRIGAGEVTAAGVREACLRVISEPEYRDRSRALAAAMRGLPSPAEIARRSAELV